MLRSFITNWLNSFSSNKPKAPKEFKVKNRSIFLNRYAGVFYFLIAWHTFGYLIVKLAKVNANKRGLEVHEVLAEGSNLTKIDIGRDFKVKITEFDKED